MSVRLSCPSCNTAFVLDALPDNRRATCPRCGDTFPIRTYTEEADGQRAPTPGAGGTERASRTRGEGRRMVGVLIGALVLILLAGLPPFLVHFARKIKSPEPAVAPATTAIPPAQLAALGYLRADCNVVFAVQPGPLLHYSARTKQEPRDVLAQAGLPDVARGTVEQFGVPLAQIDHIAGGVGLGDGADALRLALVLVLKQPLADEDEFLKKLSAKPAAGKKPRHSVVVGKFPLLLAQRFADGVGVRPRRTGLRRGGQPRPRRGAVPRRRADDDRGRSAGRRGVGRGRRRPRLDPEADREVGRPIG